MALLDLFRPIRDVETLVGFIDLEAEALGRAVVETYLQGRAGTAAKQLFATAKFIAARDRAQHEAYPVALAMIGEMVLAELAAPGEIAPDLAHGLSARLAGLFDTRPALLDAVAWAKARREVEHSIEALGSERPKSIASIVSEFSPSFLALMPVYDSLSSDDFPALRKQLETALKEVHVGFARRAGARRLIAALTAPIVGVDDNAT
jgi:hypothetical protein